MTTALDEAGRQAALLAVLAQPAAALGGGIGELGLRENGKRAASGLAVYRGQAAATADRALASAFPTLRRMVGAVDFERLAGEFWRAVPPLRGDLGEWGGGLPEFVECHPGLTSWPWLADAARLDLALHRNERAADAVLDTESLALLQTTDPAAVRLELMPGSALLRSAWPIATLFAAHRLPETAAADAAFHSVAAAIAACRGETVMVVRCGWRATVQIVDEPQAAWIGRLLDGASLATALGCAGAGFDFSSWLVEAVRERWISGVVLVASRN